MRQNGKRIKEPRTREEWQEAVDEADFWLHVDASTKYGLVEYSGRVNLERCEKMIERGRSEGVTPSPDAVERTFKRLTRPRRSDIAGAV